MMSEPLFTDRTPRLTTRARRLIVVSNDEHRVNTESIEALASLACLYQRGGRLMEIRDRGTHKVTRRVPYARLRELLSTAAEYVQYRMNARTGAEVRWRVHVPGWCVRAVLARGEWSGIPALPAAAEVDR